MRKLPHFAAVFAIAIFTGAMLIKGFASAADLTAPAQPETISVEQIQRSIDTMGLSVQQSVEPFLDLAREAKPKAIHDFRSTTMLNTSNVPNGGRFAQGSPR